MHSLYVFGPHVTSHERFMTVSTRIRRRTGISHQLHTFRLDLRDFSCLLACCAVPKVLSHPKDQHDPSLVNRGGLPDPL